MEIHIEYRNVAGEWYSQYETRLHAAVFASGNLHVVAFAACTVLHFEPGEDDLQLFDNLYISFAREYLYIVCHHFKIAGSRFPFL